MTAEGVDRALRSEHTLVIEAGGPEANYWRDLSDFRGLFFYLAWRDILVRYKQTVFGLTWAVARPFATLLVFTLVFGKIAGLPSENVPYAVMVFAGLLPWQFFTSGFSGASESLVANANMLTKIYFPRLVLPASAVIVSLVDLAIALCLLAAMMVWYGVVPDARLAFLPLFILLAFALALGAGVWAAALNVRYRDMRQIIPFVIQFGLYLSPIGFSRSVVPQNWQALYVLNPMVGIIEGFRWSLLGGERALDLSSVWVAVGMTLALLVSGLWYFRATERSFADVI